MPDNLLPKACVPLNPSSRELIPESGDDVAAPSDGGLPPVFRSVLIFANYVGLLPPITKANTVKEKCLHLLRWAIIVTFSFHDLLLGCSITHMFFNDKNGARTPGVILFGVWILQSLVSFAFLIRWHRRRSLHDLLGRYQQPQEGAEPMSAPSQIKNAVRIYFGAIIFVVFGLSLSQFGYWTGQFTVNRNIPMFFPLPWMLVVGGLVRLYMFVAWLTAITLFTTSTLTALHEMRIFNRRLEKIGAGSRDDVAEQLLHLYVDHCRLSEAVQALDRMYEAYIFAMIGTNIPTMIFTLLSALKELPHPSIELVMPIISSVFCIVQLIALILVPAKLHNAILKAETILYKNTNIWCPHDLKKYQIANTFITRISQANLGVSVWGFAVVTKPLILTTISVIVTYLSVLIQIRTTESTICNCTKTLI